MLNAVPVPPPASLVRLYCGSSPLLLTNGRRDSLFSFSSPLKGLLLHPLVDVRPSSENIGLS